MFDSKRSCILSAIAFAILFFILTYFVVDINLHAKTYEYKLVSVEKDLRKPIIQGGIYSATYALEGTNKTYKLALNSLDAEDSITVYSYINNYIFTFNELVVIYFAIATTLVMFIASIVFMINGDGFNEDN